MEINELTQFLAVARFENLHRASDHLGISPSSLSKTVGRLEHELGLKLFRREGRNIRLSDAGQLLQRRGAELVQLERSVRDEISGKPGQIHAVLAGPEVLLSGLGLGVVQSIQKKHPGATFEFQAADDRSALERVGKGNAQLAIVTAEAPANPEGTDAFASRILGNVSFQTCAGPGHPLYAAARAGRAVPVAEILKHPFVSPSYAFLGSVGLRQSVDGWRDDKFPRKVGYVSSSLSLIKELVLSGKALAYLPDYYVKTLDAAVLKITGCPYSCAQRVRLVARHPERTGWLNQLF